jgi:ketosteroid isomerase-like protein
MPQTATPFRYLPLPVQPNLPPEVLHLLELDGQFASAVESGGGKAFADHFAEDGVLLASGLPAVLGHAAIQAQSTWDAKSYHLSWLAQGAQMGPGGTMGFTWGYYTGLTTGQKGVQPKTGRYMTVWKKIAGNTWKVAMEASADGPADATPNLSMPGFGMQPQGGAGARPSPPNSAPH